VSLDPQSTRRLEQLVVLLRLELAKAEDGEVVLRVRKCGGKVSRNSRVERLLTMTLEEGM
jgi:predicted metalloprotease